MRKFLVIGAVLTLMFTMSLPGAYAQSRGPQHRQGGWHSTWNGQRGGNWNRGWTNQRRGNWQGRGWHMGPRMGQRGPVGHGPQHRPLR